MSFKSVGDLTKMVQLWQPGIWGWIFLWLNPHSGHAPTNFFGGIFEAQCTLFPTPFLNPHKVLLLECHAILPCNSSSGLGRKEFLSDPEVSRDMMPQFPWNASHGLISIWASSRGLGVVLLGTSCLGKDWEQNMTSFQFILVANVRDSARHFEECSSNYLWWLLTLENIWQARWERKRGREKGGRD